ncbi:hypothetical protein [Metamycoplasma auris]|uniref:Lipoprotein n=1 Tax=Metamycoplasma auris TaxID=51363 RepID=A0A2W7G154_9BACT|nr:hypothetical protein [Metamycoplasma auris]PZV99956.1 hypothetical protein BCF89_10434 [Metamycoplasma auris]
MKLKSLLLVGTTSLISVISPLIVSCETKVKNESKPNDHSKPMNDSNSNNSNNNSNVKVNNNNEEMQLKEINEQLIASKKKVSEYEKELSQLKEIEQKNFKEKEEAEKKYENNDPSMTEEQFKKIYDKWLESYDNYHNLDFEKQKIEKGLIPFLEKKIEELTKKLNKN